MKQHNAYNYLCYQRLIPNPPSRSGFMETSLCTDQKLWRLLFKWLCTVQQSETWIISTNWFPWTALPILLLITPPPFPAKRNCSHYVHVVGLFTRATLQGTVSVAFARDQTPHLLNGFGVERVRVGHSTNLQVFGSKPKYSKVERIKSVSSSHATRLLYIFFIYWR